MITLAGGVILNEAGHILLLHRSTPEVTHWELPGGKIEPGESAADAARRELLEELGVAVKIVRQLGDQHFQQNENTMHYTWFLVEITAGTPEPLEAKFDEVRFFSWTELATRTDLSSNFRKLLARYPQGIDDFL
jgi:8-oxo-dGTP diphosphatase